MNARFFRALIFTLSALIGLFGLAGCERPGSSGPAYAAPTPAEIRALFEWPVVAGPPDRVFKMVQFSSEPCIMEATAPASKPEYVCLVTFRDVDYWGKPHRGETRAPRLIWKENGKWTQRYYFPEVKAELKKSRAEKQVWENHSPGRLALYTLASVLAALYLCRRLPKISWNNPRLHDRSAPMGSRHIPSGNSGADRIGGAVSGAVEAGIDNMTPAGFLSIFGMLLGLVGFFLGGMVVPGYWIDLAYITWIERTLVYVSAFAWAITFMRLLRSVPKLLVVGGLGYGLFWLATSAFVEPDNGIKWGEPAKSKSTQVKLEEDAKWERNGRQQRLYSEALFFR